MKKSIKIILIIAVSLAVMIISISLLISPLTKRYVEKNSKKLVGRVVTMDKFQINLFTGSLKMKGFEIKESNEKDTFFKFDTLDVKLKIRHLLKHKVTLQRIHLSNAYLQISQNQKSFNFDDIIAKFKSGKKPEKEKKSTPWIVELHDIRLKQNHIIYNDLKIKTEWDVKDVNINIPEIFFSDKNTDVGLHLQFANGGKLHSRLLYDLPQSTYQINLQLDHFSIQSILPYLQQNFNIGTLKGFLNTDIHITGDMDHLMNSSIKGKVDLHSVDVRDDHQNKVMSADEIGLDVEEIQIKKSKFIFHKISSKGFSSVFVREKDSTNNFTYIIKTENTITRKEKPSKTEKSVPIHLIIKKLELHGSEVEFKDNTLTIPFDYVLNQVNISAENVAIDKSNDIDIKGNMGPTGKAHIHWRGSIQDFTNQDLTVELTNVRLKDFTPYSVAYFAYPITAGNINFYSQNTITNNYLNGINKIDMYKCEVDKVRKDIKPVMKIPMRFALYVLTDREGKIELELPVKGDVRSPEFSYKKIIIKALVNVLVKVVTAPVSFIAHSLGLDGDQLKEIEFSVLEKDFTSEQYGKFDQLAQMVLAKPNLLLELKQNINYTEAFKEQAFQDLKVAYYIHNHSDKKPETLGVLDWEEIDKIEENDKSLLKFAHSLLKDTLDKSNIYDKAQLIYKNQLPEEVTQQASKRNQMLEEYLVTRKQVPKTSFTIATVSQVNNKTYDEKSKWDVTFTMPGDQSVATDSIASGK